MLLKKQWVNDEIREKIRKYFKKNNNENTTIQNLWDVAKTSLLKKKVHSNTGLFSKNKKNLK